MRLSKQSPLSVAAHELVHMQNDQNRRNARLGGVRNIALNTSEWLHRTPNRSSAVSLLSPFLAYGVAKGVGALGMPVVGDNADYIAAAAPTLTHAPVLLEEVSASKKGLDLIRQTNPAYKGLNGKTLTYALRNYKAQTLPISIGILGAVLLKNLLLNK